MSYTCIKGAMPRVLMAIPKIIMIEGNRVVLKNVKAEILLGDSYRASFLDAMKDKLMTGR